MKTLILACIIAILSGESLREIQRRELWLQVQPNVIKMPADKDSAKLKELELIPPAMSECLQTFGVELIFIAFPEFDPADSVEISPTGMIVKKPTFTNLYKLRFPKETDFNVLIDALENLEGVIYAERLPEIEVNFEPNDDYFENQWGLHQNSDADIDALA